MDDVAKQVPLRGRLIDSLYTEAMVLADEARSYFDQGGLTDREALTPLKRVTLSCESLRVTTRLMHVLSWLLTQRAIDAGQIATADPTPAEQWQGLEAQATPLEGMPPAAVAIIDASRDLCARVARLDSEEVAVVPQSPALGLLSRLEQAF
jgi:regulator of CtrA degradation